MGMIQRFAAKVAKAAMSPVNAGGGWISLIREPFAGAWQQNKERWRGDVLQNYAVYACLTRISQDIGKLPFKLEQRNPTTGIWEETTNPAYSPLLRQPNSYQNHIQFKEWWITSKEARGNTYALKQRDARGVVTALYILDPLRVRPLVTEYGDVYYQLDDDELNDVPVGGLIVPASEIIHDRINCLFHPLVGIGPLYASALAARNGLQIQSDSEMFFGNGARPGGVLTAPGSIAEETAKRMKDYWDENFTGKNAGKVAVLGDGLKFEPMRATAMDSQIVEQLKLSGLIVCSAWHMPPWKIGLTDQPNRNVSELNTQYYQDCLQSPIEQMEECLNTGLSIPSYLRVQVDVDVLLRMDQAGMFEMLGTGVKNSVLAPNEARKRVNYAPVAGGDSVFMQQQNYSLEDLARRGEKGDPFNTGSSSTPAPAALAEPDNTPTPDAQAERALRLLNMRSFTGA